MDRDNVRGRAVVMQPGDGPSYWQPVPANGHADPKLYPGNTGFDALSMGYQTIAPASRVREHSHGDQVELQICFRGSGRVMVDGVAHKLTFGDFGLTHDQLNFYVNRKIALNDGTLRMGASDKLQFLGQEWATKHGNPVVSSVSMSFAKHALDGSGKVTVVPVDTWKASS